MCDQATQTIIENIVTQKVINSEMFTAFDISVAAQNELKSNQMFDASVHRHQHLKNDVHAAINRITNGAYARELRDVGAPSDAYVYYRTGSDPSNYVPMDRKDAPAAVSADPYTIQIHPTPTPTTVDPTNLANAAADSVQVAPAASTPSNIGNPDARGTVCIPKHLMQNAGFLPGDTAIAYQGKDSLNRDCLVLVGRANAAAHIANMLTSYTVDYHGNVRVTAGIFSQANLTANQYECDGDSTQVFVRPN